MHWAFLLFWWVPQSLLLKNSSTAWGCYQHTLLLGCYSAGDEQSWFPSNMMLGIDVHQSEGPLDAFLQILSVFSCVYTEERIDSCHTAIKPRSMECCSDVCPSVEFSYLHIWSWSSSRVTIRFLVTTLTKALLHQLLSLARRPDLRRVLVVSTYKGNRDYMCRLTQTCFWALQADLLTSGLGFCSDMHYHLFRPFIKTCVPFQIIPIQLNLPQINFTQSVVTSTSNMNAPERNSVVPQKGMNTYAMESLKFFIFNKFAKMLKNFFALPLWCKECRFMWKKK